MKFLGLFFVLFSACQLICAEHAINFQTNLVRAGLGDDFKAALEKIRELLKKGNATIGIPVLDPFKLEHYVFDFEDPLAKFSGIVKDVLLEGLSEYVVENADFKLAGWKATLNLSLPIVKGKTVYKADGILVNKIPLYGAGSLRFEATGFRFATQAKLKVNLRAKTVSIVSFNSTAISLEKLKVDMTGLYNNEELAQIAGALVSDVATDFLKDYQNEITTKVNEVMLKKGNQVLENFSLDDILAFIGRKPIRSFN